MIFIIIYILGAFATELFLHVFMGLDDEPILEFYFSLFFPLVWLYILFRLPIAIYECISRKDN